MKRNLALSLAVLLVLAAPLHGQAIPAFQKAPAFDAQTPGDCTAKANEWRNTQSRAISAAMQAAGTTQIRSGSNLMAAFTAVMTESQRAAGECGRKFDVESVPTSQLADLAALYAYTGDTTRRWRATERAMAATDLPPRAHAQAMVLAVNQELVRNATHFGIIERAEQLMTQIDALPDSLADIKLGAHQQMIDRYEFLDVDDGLRKHATAVLSLGQKLGKQNRVGGAYLALARAMADELHPDSALMVLDGAEKVVGADLSQRMFSDFRNRYALIGTQAAPVTGTWWVNAPAKPAAVSPGAGKVTVVEFTAHWCIPCRNSYPGMRSLAERFRGKPFQAVLATSLYGFIGDRKELTQDQEIAADEDYFGKENGLPFMVAINAPVMGANGRQSRPGPDEAYRVSGIPQIAIIDRRGVIRQIVTGWDQGNTKRIGDLIERLMQETTVP